MAKLFYQLGGAGVLNVYDDPQVLQQTDLEDQRDALVEIQGLSDELRGFLAQGGIPGLGIPGGFPDLATFDAAVDDDVDRLKDILEYFNYESGSANLTVRTGDWFTPEAVEVPLPDFTGVGFEPDKAIDVIGGDPDDPDHSTWWQSEINGTREIIFRIRDFPKKIEGIRLRVSNSGEGRSQLQNVTIKAAGSIANLDNVGNTFATDVDFTWAGSNWIEHTFASAAFSKRYIKLEVATSLHSNTDHVRIRSIQARVGITNHDK